VRETQRTTLARSSSGASNSSSADKGVTGWRLLFLRWHPTSGHLATHNLYDTLNLGYDMTVYSPCVCGCIQAPLSHFHTLTLLRDHTNCITHTTHSGTLSRRRHSPVFPSPSPRPPFPSFRYDYRFLVRYRLAKAARALRHRRASQAEAAASLEHSAQAVRRRDRPREREGGRERQRQRDRETEIDRERQRERQRQTEIDTERDGLGVRGEREREQERTEQTFTFLRVSPLSFTVYSSQW
jgi:hypothetical protein